MCNTELQRMTRAEEKHDPSPTTKTKDGGTVTFTIDCRIKYLFKNSPVTVSVQLVEVTFPITLPNLTRGRRRGVFTNNKTQFVFICPPWSHLNATAPREKSHQHQ